MTSAPSSATGATCWTLVEGAARGEAGAGARFAETYLGTVRRVLSRRWTRGPLVVAVEDAVQEVFLELLRAGGALARADRNRVHSFRSFLGGVVRNVAARHEERAGRAMGVLPEGLEPAARAASVSRQLDLAFARDVVRRAGERQRAWAKSAGAEAMRRVELLELRFRDGLPIRDIAQRWGVAPERLHREFTRAKAEFRQALTAEVSFHCDGTAADIDRECRDLIALLG